MVRFTILQFIVLLVTWRNNTVLGVSLSVAETTCVGNNITLKCSENSFTSATWSRNGSTALSTCTSGGFCTTDAITINGIKYSFTGNPSGTEVSFQLQLVENGIEWVCNYNAQPYVYKFDVSEECPTVTPPEETSTTHINDQTFSSQNPFTASSHSEPTDTTIMTSTDDGFTPEVTPLIKTDNVVGTLIAVVIPVAIFLITIGIIIFILTFYRCSKRSKSTPTKKGHEPTKPKKNRVEKNGDRISKSGEKRYYVGECNTSSSTIPQDFNMIDNEGHTNALYHPCRNIEPYSPHLYSDHRRPYMVYIHDEPSRFMGYSICKGDVTNLNGQFRNH